MASPPEIGDRIARLEARFEREIARVHTELEVGRSFLKVLDDGFRIHQARIDRDAIRTIVLRRLQNRSDCKTGLTAKQIDEHWCLLAARQPDLHALPCNSQRGLFLLH